MRKCSDRVKTLRNENVRSSCRVRLTNRFPDEFRRETKDVDRDERKISRENRNSSFNPNSVPAIVQSKEFDPNGIVERFRTKIEQSQTPTSKDTCRMLKRLTKIIQKHIPDFVLQENPFEPNYEEKTSNLTKIPSAASLHSQQTKPKTSPSIVSRVLSRIKSGTSALKPKAHDNQCDEANVSSKKSRASLTNSLRNVVDFLKPNRAQHKSKSEIGQSSFRTDSPLSSAHLKVNRSFSPSQTSMLNCSERKSTNEPKTNVKKTINQPSDLDMEESMNFFKEELTKETFRTLINQRKDSKENKFIYWLKAPSRCCRTCRTQRRLASVAGKSLNLAIKNAN